jgi:bacterial/archaeal transporter family protein
MNWILPAALTALCYGLYNFFIKLSSGHIHQIAGSVILQVTAALVGGGILAYLHLARSPLHASPRGVWFAVLAGIFVGLAEILSFYVFAKGIPASVGIPLIVGGTVIAGVLLGLVFLGETLRPVDYLAVILIVAGTAILGARG